MRRTGSIRRDVDSIRAVSPTPGSPAVEGGPPKIPRRAARRAAPVPPGTPSKTAVERVVEDKAAEGNEREKKPDEAEKKPEDAEKKVDEGEAKVEEDRPKAEEHKPEAEDDKPKTEDPPVPRPPPRRAVPPPPAPPLPARVRGHELAHPSEAKSAEDSKLDEVKPAPENPVAGSAPEAQPHTNVPSDAKENVASKPSVATLTTSTINGNIAQAGSDPTGKVNGVDKERNSGDSGEEKKPTEEDTQFVGEHTWEERAYKEIVKLRENMFWARVGSAW